MGQRVELAWWDPVRGTWMRIKPLLLGQTPAAAATAQFVVGAPVLFAFVFYERGPQYLRAIGPTLDEWRGRSALRAALLAGEDHVALDDVRTGLGRSNETDARCLSAVRWRLGEMRPLFPTAFKWSVAAFCANTLGPGRRLVANAALRPGGDWRATLAAERAERLVARPCRAARAPHATGSGGKRCWSASSRPTVRWRPTTSRTF